jgi:GAF domain-containing protein
VVAADDTQVKALVHPAPDLIAAAQLCTRFGRVDDTRQTAPLLQEAARILDAVGLIVWIWDAQATELRPALAHGYSGKVLAQLPRVGRETDNATAAAFRVTQTCVVNGSDLTSGALVVPLMTPSGCMGVLAIELQHGGERSDSVRALATIFAAQLARLIGAARPAGAADRRLA